MHFGVFVGLNTLFFMAGVILIWILFLAFPWMFWVVFVGIIYLICRTANNTLKEGNK